MRAWHIKSRPQGVPTAADFELREASSPALQDGQARVRNIWLSVDPYMRGLLNERDSYMPSLPLGAPMIGGAVGEVTESCSPELKPGQIVTHMLGWRDETVAAAGAFSRLTPTAPLELYLGHLGLTGMTAYFGLLCAAEAKPGDIVFVSAAAGAVGSAVVQIAKIKAMTVIASAGGPEKCALLEEWGADRTIDHKAPGSMEDKLRVAAPDGVDVYFDNVGGDHFDAALACARLRARVAVCGAIGGYNNDQPTVLKHAIRILIQRITIRGFMAPDYPELIDQFMADMTRWLEDGSLRRQETVHEGLEATPAAFVDLFSGGNTGKMLVRL